MWNPDNISFHLILCEPFFPMDKNQEREIFDKVFSDLIGLDVHDSEAPDFICKNDNRETVLGVEVTELYQHESHARLKNIDGYTEKLLDHEKYLHKDDKDILEVKDVTLEKKDLSEKHEIKAIKIDVPPFEKIVNLLEEVIEEKNSKTDTYSEKSIRNDLIISDASYLFNYENFSDIYNPLSSLIDKNHITNSKFREIWVLTDKRDNNPAYFPLKLNLVAEEIMIYQSLIDDKNIENPNIGFGSLLLSLSKTEFDFIKTDISENYVNLIFSCWVYRFTEEGTNVRDYSNIPAEIPSGKKIKNTLNSGEEFRIADKISNELISERDNIEFGYCPNFHFSKNG